MSEENTETLDQSEEQSGNTENNGTDGASDEKKYSDKEMNNLVKKKSEKAVAKLLKELGITDKEKAKSILASAAKQETEKNAQTGSAENSALETELAGANRKYERAMLENVFLTSNVQPEKVEKAVKLIDIEKCRDEDGEFDRKKAVTEIEALLKEWPELAKKADNGNVGFQIGSDGQSNKGGENNNTANKPKVPQKSWNRFN